MQICLLMGSPRLEGTTARLAEAFAEGARSAGHAVSRIDVAELDVAPCTAGLLEALAEGKNVDNDDMNRVFDALLDADVVVLATPLYYYGMTAQLKTVIDRLVSKNDAVASRGARALLLAVAAGPDEAAMAPLEAQFRAMCGYLRWTPVDCVYGLGLAMHSLESTGALEKARSIGASL